MHPFFASLNVYETALLLTTLTVGGSDQVNLFDHLPEDIRRRLTDRADALRVLPAEGRVPLMVRELKELLAQGGRRGIERVDPTWLVHALRGETPRLVGAVLVGLPPAVVRSVLKRLPAAVRHALPPKQQLRQIDPVVKQGVRLYFEQRFFPMPDLFTGPMQLQDIVHLERAELHALSRDLGLTELGQAFAAVGKIALVELCRRLPESSAQELIAAVRATSKSGEIPDPRTAQRFLSKVVVNFEDTEEFLQKAGLWRLAKAYGTIAAGPTHALSQRLPRRAGHLLLSYIAKAQEMGDLTPESLQRLQDAILGRVVVMSRGGQLGPQWATIPMHFHDPATAMLALAEGTSGAVGPSGPDPTP